MVPLCSVSVLGILRFVGMAFKAIDFDSRVYVATATEVILVTDTGNLAVFTGCIVALDTFFQTVFTGAYTTSHCVITLMENVLHVVFTHVCSWFYTLVTLAFRNSRHQVIGLACQGQGQQQADPYNPDKLFNASWQIHDGFPNNYYYSPIPMSM